MYDWRLFVGPFVLFAAALLIGHSDAFPSVVLCALAGGWFMSNNFGKKKS